MPSFEQLELADEMGFMFWQRVLMNGQRKVENGYHRFFEDYAEKTSLI
jgi:beta-galactosidase